MKMILEWIRHLFDPTFLCGLCGRFVSKRRHNNIIDYIAQTDDGKQEAFQMHICNECANTLEHLRDKTWLKTKKE